jgi:N-acetylneuraminic acid mutarotase
MAAAACGGQIYFFGGVGSETGAESILDVSDDLFAFDPASAGWRRIVCQRPIPPARRCAGFARVANAIELWGGSGVQSADDGRVRYNFLNDHWRFDPAAERWLCLRPTDDHRVTPPAGRAEMRVPYPRYTPVFQPVGNRLFLFGGYTEDRLGNRQLNDAWILEQGSWHEVGADGFAPGRPAQETWPGVRYGCMSSADDNAVYICGGASAGADHIDLWRFDVCAEAWEALSPDARPPDSPAPRYCAAFAHHRGRLVLFGGRSRWHPKQNYSDLWIFDLRTKHWERVHDHSASESYSGSGTVPSYHAKSAVAVEADALYMFGGEGRRGHVSDFWRLDLQQLQWELLQVARSDDPILW